MNVELEEATDSAVRERRDPGTSWWTGTKLMALGVLILQLTWMFSVPPFRGSDEFDHVYRAAAAARGQWFVTPSDATRGTGAWLDVPSDIVKAAHPQCEDLVYTHANDCVGTPHADGTVRIASGAGRYHPLFYAIVGTPALPFHGDAALYVMRLATVLLSWLLFCLALGATRRWALTPWPTAAIAIASTPVLLYSTGIVAPNGVEMMAALTLWTATLGLLRHRARTDTYLVTAATVGGCILVTTRSLGPLICALALVTILIAVSPTLPELRTLLRRRSSIIAGALVGLSTVLSVAWILGMHALNIGQRLDGHLGFGHRLRLLFRNEILWALQTIAAFPLRDEATKMPVYACYLVLFVGMLVYGFRAARGSQRLAIALSLLITCAVPFLIGLNPHSYPGLWQGRYGLPYAVGIALLIGFALDRSGSRLSTRLRIAVLALYVAAQAIGPVDVLDKGRHHQLADYADFPHPMPAMIALSAGIGAAILWWGASRRPAEVAR
jgi:hypothetical protein